MQPFRFGPSGQQLFAVYHPPRGQQPAKAAVLICNPFGQEALRIQRFFKVLADRLTRKGIAVLRFDYVGTGDSDGEDQDGQLPLWQQNIAQAAQELRHRSQVDRLTCIGARIGATLALQAAPTLPFNRLILWEPVLDGPAYLRHLAAEHVKGITSLYRTAPPAPGPLPRDEVLGFGMSPELIQQIQTLSPDSLHLPPGTPVTVVAKADDLETQHLRHHAGQPGGLVQFQSLDVPFDWTSEEALNTALVPPAALQLLATLAEEALHA